MASLSPEQLDAMIAEATVDAYDHSEQVVGFFIMLEEHLPLPFETELLGVAVQVEQLEITQDDQIVAICKRGEYQQRVSILELPMPPVEGLQWVAAFRQWSGGRA